MSGAVVEDALPAFLPTALPHDSGTSSSTGNDDVSGAVNAMEKLTIVNNQPLQPAQPVMATDAPAHGQPPPLHESHPIFPIGDMSLLHGGDHHYSQPPWTTAYPLPPIIPPMAPHDALGLVHGPGGPRPAPPMFVSSFSPIPVPPRPHPFVSHPILYVSFVPADMTSDDFDQPLRRQGIAATVIRLPNAVKPHARLYPDSYYNWMTKNGCLKFQNLHDTEKALSILISHQYFVSKNVLTSPLPPPNCAPLPPAPVAPRFIRPVRFTYPDTTANYPQPGQLWDFVRPWGSIREVSVMLESSHIPDGPPGNGECRWRATVQFWFEDEALRFEANHATLGPLCGWEINVCRDPSYIPTAPLPFQQPVTLYGPPPMGPPFAPVGSMDPQFSPPPMMAQQFSPPPMVAPQPQFSSQAMVQQQFSPSTVQHHFAPAMVPHFSPLPMVVHQIHQSPVAVQQVHQSPKVVQRTDPEAAGAGLTMTANPPQPQAAPAAPAPTVTAPKNPEVSISPNGVITPLSPVSPAPVHSGNGSVSSSGSEPLVDTVAADGVKHVLHPGHFAPGSGGHIPTPEVSVPHLGHSVPFPHQPRPYIAPWARQNGGASFPVSPPYGPSEQLPPDDHHSIGRHQGKPNRRKSWKEVPGGFVSENGQVIQHVPNRYPGFMRKTTGPRPQTNMIDPCCLIVKNLTPDVSSAFLGDIFSKFGYVMNVRLMRDENMRPRGFAFISFQYPEEAASALNQMDGAELAGRRLSVAYQQPRFTPNRFPSNNRGRGGGRRNSNMFAQRSQALNGEVAEAMAVSAIPAAAMESKVKSPVEPRSNSRERLPASAPDQSRLQVSPVEATAPQDLISHSDITLDALSVMSPSNALAVVNGGGQELLRKVNIAKQSSTCRLDQSPQSKKLSIIGTVNKLILHGPSVQGISPSRVVACIREFVNHLDEKEEEAFVELLHYPAVVNAMIVHQLKSPRSTPRSTPPAPSHKSLPA